MSDMVNPTLVLDHGAELIPPYTNTTKPGAAVADFAVASVLPLLSNTKIATSAIKRVTVYMINNESHLNRLD